MSITRGHAAPKPNRYGTRAAGFMGQAIVALTLLLAARTQAQGMLEPATDLIVLENPTDTGETIEVFVGRSKAIQTPWPISRVAVGDPAIADVQILGPNELLAVAKGAGVTDLFIWNEAGSMWEARIRVSVDVAQLKTTLKTLFPGASLEVTETEGVYFFSGTMANADQIAQLHGFLEASGIKFADLTTLPGLQQVQLQVRVAEVNRVAVRKLGVNALGADDDYFAGQLIGPESGGALNPLSIGPLKGTTAGPDIPFKFVEDVGVSPFVTLLAGFPGSDLELFIQALAENQYLRILAEPNLVALSGEEASFLAGGEFPIPVVQGTAAGGGISITIEYKEFGVRLKFRPMVTGNGVIRMHVAPEVSDLSNVGAVEIQGFRIPSILTRRSETTLEVKDGQTFAMAGLLNQTTNSRNSRVPLLGDLPVLGSLFRSVSYQNGQSELVILVTASLVEPLSGEAKPEVPGEFDAPPNDWEFFLLGRLKGAAATAAPLTAGPQLEVPGLAQLKGPGAWASYGPGN